ncbi:Arginase [Mycena venus]|uniref:Arginase n=1 Tax=Mycena venus TaxID=2733690 RepID=A0A8H6YXA7_9AGAR|nr:Arginase [Mycena venus]
MINVPTSLTFIKLGWTTYLSRIPYVAFSPVSINHYYRWLCFQRWWTSRRRRPWPPPWLSGMGWEVKFDGHLQFDASNLTTDLPIGKLKNPRLVSKAAKTVAEVVAGYASWWRPLTRHGYHFRNLDAYPDACVFYIDAHADINATDTTISGNIHGMSLSFVLGLGSKIPDFGWVKAVLKPERLVYIGLRDVDPSEQLIPKQHKIKAFSMHDVDKYGIGKVVKMALNHVNPDGKLPIHLSFDIDALDPFAAPSTVCLVDGGLTLREGRSIC